MDSCLPPINLPIPSPPALQSHAACQNSLCCNTRGATVTCRAGLQREGAGRVAPWVQAGSIVLTWQVVRMRWGMMPAWGQGRAGCAWLLQYACCASSVRHATAQFMV